MSREQLAFSFDEPSTPQPYTLTCADVLTWAQGYTGPKFHAMLCDPPYHLTEHGGFSHGLLGTPLRGHGSPRTEEDKQRRREAQKGFMGKSWDGGDLAFQPDTWKALAQHLLPGAFIMAFASSRGFHRVMTAMEDAGLRLYPSIFGWLTGSSFPKATRIDTQVDARKGFEPGFERTVTRYLREARNRQGLTNQRIAEVFGFDSRMAAHWCAEETDSQPAIPRLEHWEKLKLLLNLDNRFDEAITAYEREVIGPGNDKGRTQNFGGTPAHPTVMTAPATPLAQTWAGHRYGGQCLKNSLEPVIVAQVPYAGKPVQSIVHHGSGALWIDGARIGTNGGMTKHSQSNGDHRDRWEGNTPTGVWEQHGGRWPPNFALSHLSLPVVRLSAIIQPDIADLIRRYFHGYDDVQLLRERFRTTEVGTEPKPEILQCGMLGCSETGNHQATEDRTHLPHVSTAVSREAIVGEERPPEVLQKSVSESLSVGSLGRREEPALWQASQYECQNQDDESGTTTSTRHQGAETSLMAGRSVQESWVLSDTHQHINGNGSGTGTAHDGKSLHSGTSTSHGQADRPCIKPKGNRPSSEWEERGQQARKSGDMEPRQAYTDTSTSRERTDATPFGESQTSQRERPLEILARDIPDRWLEYFELTGEDLGCVQVGTRQVDVGHGAAHIRHNNPSIGYQGTKVPCDSHGYEDANGQETVAAYRCSENCPVAKLDAQAGVRPSGSGNKSPAPHRDNHVFGKGLGYSQNPSIGGDTGSASRFFHVSDFSLDVAEQLAQADPVRYEPKASRSERDKGLNGERNIHPTVKNIQLCRWLATLLLPPAAYAPRRLLNVFAGTGSEAIGALLAGWDEVMLVEQDASYVALAEQRLAYWSRRTVGGV